MIDAVVKRQREIGARVRRDDRALDARSAHYDSIVTEPDSIEKARASLRIRETALIVMAFVFPVTMLLAGIPLTWLLKTPAPLWTIAAVCVTLIAAIAIWHQRFRCPRCGELFFSRPGMHRPLSTRCVHCGLELVR